MLSRAQVALPTLALIGAVALTSCTSSSSNSSNSTKDKSATGSTRTARTTGGRSVEPTTVADKLETGLATATSAHLAVSTELSGQRLEGAGDVRLTKGAISQANLQQALPSGLGTITVVVSGGKTYAKLPSALRTDSSKLWVLLTPDSRSTVVSQLASTVQPILTVASPASLVAFTRSASSVTDLGQASTGGVTTTHYRVIVDAGSLPTSVPSSITAGGKSSIPIDMYLDATGRPRQVTGTFSISGQTVTPTITLSDYDAPVSITAPPAEQVGAR
ncbi:hypothetical protein [uncultured Jatrophihabitans sp.]|uniref:hypothetical protein n=1 Tax=uncultured Jatrophihabitans sp. TaxID=1610747 RepID=UPI0035C9FA4D